MAKVLNRVLGGRGSGGASANIYVTGLSQTDTCTMTTPSGKVVNGVWGAFPTSSDPSVTTNGYTFHANEYGIHTITATNGTKTSTEEVLVDALMDYYVEMDLSKLYLYKYGDERESVTGGWAVASKGNGTWTKSIDSIVGTISSGKSSFSIQSLVDMTPFTKMVVLFSSTTPYKDYRMEACGVGVSKTALIENNNVKFTWVSVSDTADHTMEIDLTSVNQSLYAQVQIQSNSGTNTVNFKAVWLE